MLKAKKITLIIIIILLGIFSLFLKPLAAQVVAEEALVILTTNTIEEMQVARAVIEKKGGRIKSIFPTQAFIAEIPKYTKQELDKLNGQIGFIDSINYSEVKSLTTYKSSNFERSCFDAVQFWNNRLKTKNTKTTLSLDKVRKEKEEPFRDTAILPDIPKTKEERDNKQKEYLSYWQKAKEKLLQEESSKKAKRIARSGKLSQSKESQKPNIVKAALGYDPAKTTYLSTTGFGKAYGAGFYDTANYFAGDIAVSIFFIPGSKGEWTKEHIDEIYNGIVSVTMQFIDDEPNANIKFTFIKEVNAQGLSNRPPGYYSYSAKPVGGGPDITYTWNNDFNGDGIANSYDEWTYDNYLRNTYNTHWAYFVVVVNGGSGDGPFGRGGSWVWKYIVYDDDLRSGFVPRHETMHNFGVMDQYDIAGAGASKRWGYLGITNANAMYNDGTGYFGGKGEAKPDLMAYGGPIGIYSRQQAGWLDSDGDGIIDVRDTYPETDNLAKTGNNPYTYTGRARDIALPSNYPDEGAHSSVTINTIKKVEYRINNMAWQEAMPIDGAFDSAEEQFSFTTPQLKNGTYTIEVRAANSVDNVEVSYAKDTFTITGSQITNIRPFGYFAIFPPEGSTATVFTFDASGSTDFEDNPQSLQVRWDFNNDGIWDTPYSTNKIINYTYSLGGLKTVKLEVKDSNNVTHSITKQLNILANFDLLPHAYFEVSPVAQFGNSDIFTVNFDATGSYSPIDSSDIQVRWDFEGDGTWDTDYSSNLNKDFDYRIEEFGEIGKIEESAQKFCIWEDFLITYNSIFNIMDPKRPFRVANISQFSLYQDDMFVSEYYIYITYGWSKKNFSVIDMTDPANPRFVSTYNLNTTDSTKVFVLDKQAFVAYKTKGFDVIDISNKWQPKIKGSYRYLGADIKDIYASGNYVYLADSKQGIIIVDVSAPEEPIFSGSYKPQDPLSVYNIFTQGNYVYCLVRNPYNLAVDLLILDVSNYRTIRLESGYSFQTSINNIYVSGNNVYACGSRSSYIIDTSNIDAPVLKNEIEQGWGVKIIPKDRNIYLSRGVNGIIIIASKFKVNPSYFQPTIEVKDCLGNTALAKRLLYAIPYDYSPILQDVIATGYMVEPLATDPDLNTTWDGLLEARYDFGNDGTWDTRFSTIKKIEIPLEYANKDILCEVRDRFGATASKLVYLPQPPQAPSNLIISSGLVLKWQDNSDNETGFEVERSIDRVNFSILPIALKADTTSACDVYNLEPNTNYFYRVKTLNGSVESMPSNIVMGKTGGYSLGDVNFDGKKDVFDGLIMAQYVVNKITALSGKQNEAGDIDMNDVVDRVDIDLFSFYLGGRAPLLPIFFGSTGKPANFKAELKFNQAKQAVALTWNGLSGAESYFILRSESNYFPGSESTRRTFWPIRTTSFIDDSVQPGKTYRYGVFGIKSKITGDGVKKQGYSLYSDIVTVKVPAK